ncbi:MAG TPA: LuxR C-terminal-related transcriptional regulator, partial [Thermoleophilaceae bacterium]|nr:LuxR C-terminal-related transcriptional regulator [Thermoleophilaceae bacterium]
TDHVDFRGEPAVAKGWLGRARRLLEDLEPGPEHGWLWVHEAEKLLFANDTRSAHELATRAAELGKGLGVVDLEMMGLATEGLVLVTEGQVERGISRLDEAAAAALSGEFGEIWASGWCLCFMIYACERARDYDRAGQWCKRAEEWSERRRMELLAPVCRAHYAGVLIWRGTWAEAEIELEESAGRLAEIRPPVEAEATVRLADLRRRRGQLDQAAELFERVAEHPLALLGLGEVCLDRGEPAGARDHAEQYLREAPPRAGTLRAAGLELLARAETALGDRVKAAEALEELEEVARLMATDPLRAAAAFAAGTVAAASGELERARTAFEDATRFCHRSGAPFEAARARLELARVLGYLGRPNDAVREARAAATSLRRIGATLETERADALAVELGGQPAAKPSPLTKRECEVLRLVAEGSTNREIAERLVLSEHTVNRHVTNILAKLGSPSRSAAVAEALRRELI